MPTSGRVYIDTQILIYTVERFPQYVTVLRPFWESVRNGKIELLSSEIIVLESLVMPIRLGDAALAADFERILNSPKLRLKPISLQVLRQAASLRAVHKSLKTPDAIHSATAMLELPDQFLTNDRGYQQIPGLPVLVLDDLITQP